MKYRKKPVVVEAVQFTSRDVVEQFMGRPLAVYALEGTLSIPTLEGEMRATPGDWVIKDVNGEFYPCRPDIFEKTYEPLHEPIKPGEGGG